MAGVLGVGRGLYIGVATVGILGRGWAGIQRSDDWRRLFIGVTTGGILGLELAAIHRSDDRRDVGAQAGGYTRG